MSKQNTTWEDELPEYNIPLEQWEEELQEYEIPLTNFEGWGEQPEAEPE